MIDYSQLQTFIDCPRKYYNRYKLGLKKITFDERDISMEWGKQAHKALEIYYKTKDVNAALDNFKLNYQGLAGDKVKTPANGLNMLQWYFDYQTNNITDLGDKNFEIVAVETIDNIIIDDIIYHCKIDLILKNNAGYWVVDHKFTQKSLHTFINKFTPNMQVSGYSAYVTEKYGQCSGFIPNVIFCGYRERVYKGEQPGFYCRFERDIVNRNIEQIEDFKNNVRYWMSKLSQSENDNYWGKNESQCSMCGFRELCTQCDDSNVRDTLYVKYDPYSYLKGEE